MRLDLFHLCHLCGMRADIPGVEICQRCCEHADDIDADTRECLACGKYVEPKQKALYSCESCGQKLTEEHLKESDHCRWCGLKIENDWDYDAEAKDREVDHENS